MAKAELGAGAAFGAEIQKQGDTWTLVLVRDLKHPPQRVWRAITDPEQLRQWAPFDPDRDLATVGAATFTTVGAPRPMVSEATVKRADAPRVLEVSWGEQDLRWELEPHEKGTRLTLWHNINKGFISMGAAGWHLCLEVLGQLLAGESPERVVGLAALQNPNWQRLNTEYAALFGVSAPRPF